ncbi:MAG: YhjD/YihY/BrkB family envelope integrity protein [Burkholderiales bacterium]
MGAALSYYTLFSIAPLLLIAIAVAGFVFGEEAARGQISGQLAGMVGPEGAKAVEGMLAAANQPKEGLIATIVGIVTLILGATTVFGELQNAMDRIWRAPAREKSTGWWNLIRTRLLSFGMVLGIAFLLTVSLILSAGIAALGKWWGAAEAIAHVLEIAISFGIITVLFALIYKFIPRVHVAWRDVWTGAAVTSALFAIGKLAIGLYLGKSSVASAFGAAGSLVVVMVWVYYSAQIFLFGAEFTWVYANEFGSRRGKSLPQTGSAATTRAAANETPASPVAAYAKTSAAGGASRMAPAALPVPAGPMTPVTEPPPLSTEHSLRKRHPFGSLGVALVAGIALAAAKSLAENHWGALRRRFT